MKEDVLFKRTPFGGFDRVEVISYIQQLKTTQQKYKLMLDEKDSQILKLTQNVDDLENEASALRTSVENYEKTIADLQAEIAKLQEENEKLSSADVGETVRMCDDLVETASDTAKKLIAAAEEKLDNAQKTVDDIIKEIENREKVTAKQAKDLLKGFAERLK
ncbi:MAG: hypothetical protein IJ447_01370 [Clostridia bacterium]|nr:hypothetical protein [Clostridia bacterium]